MPNIPINLFNNLTTFEIERNQQIVGSAHGFFCSNNYPSTIQLVENTDIHNGDWIIDSMTHQRYFASDARPIIVHNEISNWMVKYQTEHDYNASFRNNTSININTINGPSVVGSQENVVLNIGNSLNDIKDLITTLPPSEQADAKELFNELEKVESSQHPLLVEGALSKFSDLIKKHTDLLTAVGGWAVQLLIRK